MVTGVAACLAFMASSAFLLYRALAPARRIWSGEAAAADTLPTRWGYVEARNYLAYLLWFLPAASGFLLLFTGLLLSIIGQAPRLAESVAGPGIRLLLLALPLALVHIFVNATNRPRLLVPPPYRDQPGALGLARWRRARKAAGLSPTDHPITLHELPPVMDGQEPGLLAVCNAQQCGWMEFVDDQDRAVRERELRRKAGEHSDNISLDVAPTPPDHLSPSFRMRPQEP